MLSFVCKTDESEKMPLLEDILEKRDNHTASPSSIEVEDDEVPFLENQKSKNVSGELLVIL